MYILPLCLENKGIYILIIIYLGSTYSSDCILVANVYTRKCLKDEHFFWTIIYSESDTFFQLANKM